MRRYVRSQFKSMSLIAKAPRGEVRFLTLQTFNKLNSGGHMATLAAMKDTPYPDFSWRETETG